MPTKVHDETTEAPVTPAGADGAHRRLTREDILGADDLPTEDIYVPEWGGMLTVRALSGTARDVLEARYTDGRGQLDIEAKGGFRAGMVAQSVVDDSGKPIFRDTDVVKLGQKSSIALQRVFEVVARLSATDAKSIDGIVDDLKGDPSDGTG